MLHLEAGESTVVSDLIAHQVVDRYPFVIASDEAPVEEDLKAVTPEEELAPFEEGEEGEEEAEEESGEEDVAPKKRGRPKKVVTPDVE